jgi:uncharacterized membrane protein
MTKEEFLLKASEHYDELKALNKLDNMYDYEVQFSDIWNKLGRSVLESNIGTTPNDRRKKKPYYIRGN